MLIKRAKTGVLSVMTPSVRYKILKNSRIVISIHYLTFLDHKNVFYAGNSNIISNSYLWKNKKILVRCIAGEACITK